MKDLVPSPYELSALAIELSKSSKTEADACLSDAMRLWHHASQTIRVYGSALVQSDGSAVALFLSLGWKEDASEALERQMLPRTVNLADPSHPDWFPTTGDQAKRLLEYFDAESIPSSDRFKTLNILLEALSKRSPSARAAINRKEPLHRRQLELFLEQRRAERAAAKQAKRTATKPKLQVTDEKPSNGNAQDQHRKKRAKRKKRSGILRQPKVT